MRKILPIFSLGFLSLNSCVTPLTHQVTKWQLESCSRKTFLSRMCSALVTILTSPVNLVAFVIDLPLAFIEFFFGANPIKDPLIQTAQFPQGSFWFKGKKHTIEFLAIVEDKNSMKLEKYVKKKLVETYQISRLPQGKIQLKKILTF